MQFCIRQHGMTLSTEIKQLLDNIAYPLGVSTFWFLIYFFIRAKIVSVEKGKLKSIKKRDFVDAIETHSPVDDQEKMLKAKGIEDIEDKFSFIKKLFPILFIGLWAFSIFIYYLGRIPTVYVSIFATVVSVIAGVSLRPFLENLFSGVIISFFKSMRVGDTVIIDDHYGIIEEIGLTYSVLKRWDWNRLVIPNAKLLQKEIQNLTMHDKFIWAYVEFHVAPDSDLEKVRSIAIDIARKSSYFKNIEEPSFWVMGLEKEAVRCWLAAWSDTPSDAWELRNDLRTMLLISLQKEGIKFSEVNVRYHKGALENIIE